MNVMMKWLVGVFLFSLVSTGHAQNVHGTLRVVKGDVQIKSAKTGQTVRARLGEQVYPKDVIITGKDARAKIVMVDNNEINVSPDSQIEIQHYEFDPNAGKKEVLLNVIYGKVRAKVEQKYDGKTSKFQVKTPSAVAGVRGTDFLTSYDRSTKTTEVVTFRGAVAFGLPGPNGSISNPVSVTPGKVASSAGGIAPAPPAPMAKEQLAKVDNDTKAEAQPAAPSKSERTPSNDGAKKDDGVKKDDGKKSGDGGGSGANGNSSPSAKAPGGSSASAGSSADSGPGASAPGAEPAGRAPASAGGDMKFKPGDLVTGPGADGPPQIVGGPPGPPPPPPPITGLAPAFVPCNVCNELRKGKTNLTINVTK